MSQQLVLDFSIAFDLKGGFSFKVEILASSKQNSSVEISKVVLSVLKAEETFKFETWNGFSEDNLSSQRIDIQIWEKLSNIGVNSEDNIFGFKDDFLVLVPDPYIKDI